ncbi:hypothetical protein H0H81_011296, partial [Sphagnurus paluster]
MIKQAREAAEISLVKAAESMKRFYNAHRTEALEYQPGDLVWLDGKDINTKRPAKKLDDKRHGPFPIVKK